jgi:hypothetical protein
MHNGYFYLQCTFRIVMQYSEAIAEAQFRDGFVPRNDVVLFDQGGMAMQNSGTEAISKVFFQ